MTEIHHPWSEIAPDLSEHIFVAMAKMTSQIAMLTDASRKIVWVNRAFTTITGYAPEEAIGKTPGDLLQGEKSDPAVIERMRDALEGARPFKEEILNYRKDGEPYWVEIRVEPIFTASGELRGFFGLNENISQRKRDLHLVLNRQSELEAERQSVCERLDLSITAMEGVIRCSPTPIVLTDPDLVITEFNPAAEALLGYSRDEVVGKCTPEIFHDGEELTSRAIQRGWGGDLKSVGFSDFARFFQHHEVTTEEWHLVAKNGERIPTLLASSIIRTGQGEVIGYMGVMTDLRSQVEHERERQTLLSRLQNVARHLPGFIYEYQLMPDGSSSFPYASEGITLTCGVTPEDARKDASKCIRSIHPDDLNRVEDSIRESATTGQLWSCDYRVMLADGSERWVSGSANPEIQPDGSVLWFGYIRDITDRHKVEVALKRKSALLQLLNETALEFINVPVAQADAAIDKALEGLGRFFGIDRAYLFEYDFGKLKTCNTHEWCAEGIEPFKDQLQDQPIEWDSEWYFKHLQGEVVHIPDVASMPPCSVKELLTMQSIRSLLTVPMMHQDKPIGFVGFDSVFEQRTFSSEEVMLLKVFARALVSVRLRIESHIALKESRDQVEIFFDVSVGLLCVCSLQGYFLRVNHGWEIFLGKHKDAIHGTQFMNYVHPDDRLETELAMIQLANGNKIEGFVNRYIDSHGNWRSISWIAVCRNGLIYCSASDVTAEREASDALEKALDDAKQMADMRSRLISMASHEFRTPLSSIRLSAEMLQGYLSAAMSGLPPKLERHLSRIIGSADNLTRIICDVLEIEGTGSSKQALEMLSLDPSEMCRECIHSVLVDARATRKLHFSEVGEIPRIFANEVLFKSALANLLDNAFKYSPEDKVVSVILDACGGQVRIQIKDEGIGIAEDEVAKIFDPFFRSSRTTHISGTGLGLPIVLQNLQRMEGTVKFHPNKPCGSVFTILLPIHLTE